MGYSREVYDEAMGELEQRRMLANSRAAMLRERIIRKHPRAREIEQEMAFASVRVARAVLDGGDVDAAVEQIKNTNLALQSELAEILAHEGESVPNFEPQYACPRCGDTGYADGKPCACLTALLKEGACRRLSQITHMQLTTFEEMDLNYYPSETDEKTGVSPRARMRDVLEFCRCYGENFSPSAASLLLRGPTGTGKTHVSLAIARLAVQAGYSVIYGPTQQLLHQLEKEHFGRETGSSEDMMTTCDLLILDDVGAEFASPFCVASLYNLINTRMLGNLPTIVSTNLNQKQMRERYGEAITSRIVGTFQPVVFFGKDIRQIKIQQRMG